LNKLNTKLGNNISEHYRFEDMKHGFAGARADFSDKVTRARIEEAIDKLSGFFNKVL
jgi:hypothetical protein